MRKSLITFLSSLAVVFSAMAHPAAASQPLVYTDATELTLTGKTGVTAQPYHRVDLHLYPDLTPIEQRLLRYPAGVAVAFRTNSTVIGIRATYLERNIRPNAPEMTTAGFDLYIRRDGEWVFAACNVPGANSEAILVDNMDSSWKECLLYLPMYSELEDVSVGVSGTSEIRPADNPFRHRVVIFGSSFTQGVSAARSGMSYPSLIGRSTGLGIINLGVSGNSKLQPVFASILADTQADAFIFDAFSNPNPTEVTERIEPFVARVREAHPGKPLIFLQTIYREKGNFDTRVREYEERKRETARLMVSRMMERYPDVYFVEVDDPTGTDHLTSADGTHPSDLGYYRWARSIEPSLTDILSRYGIR